MHKHWLAWEKQMEEFIAKRFKMKRDQYRALVKDYLWLTAKEALKYKIIDKIWTKDISDVG